MATQMQEDSIEVVDNRPPSIKLADVKLADAIRELVRQEIGPKEEAQVAASPSWKDAVWLFICVANIALVLWWLPEVVFKDARLKVLFDILSLLTGYVCALGFSWFRAWILNLTRSIHFKVIMTVLLVILVPLCVVTRVELLQVNPDIRPSDAHLVIGDSTISEEGREDLRLRLSDYQITVTPQLPSPISPPRQFDLSYKDILRSLWDESYRPYWPLIYKVQIHRDDSGDVDSVVPASHNPDLTEVDIIIQKLSSEIGIAAEKQAKKPATADANFDKDYLAKLRQISLQQEARIIDKTTIQFHMNAENVLDYINLPYGRYAFIQRGKDCESRLEPIDVGPKESLLVDFNKPCSKKQGDTTEEKKAG